MDNIIDGQKPEQIQHDGMKIEKKEKHPSGEWKKKRDKHRHIDKYLNAYYSCNGLSLPCSTMNSRAKTIWKNTAK